MRNIINTIICHVAGTTYLQKQMVVCNLNARSVRSKTTVIYDHDYIWDHNVNMMGLTEHWLTSKDSAVKAEICPDGYSILVHERSDCRGGGTGLLYRDSYEVSMINSGVSEHGSFEYSEWLV